jgi:ferredoxin-like protein FixX
MALELTQPLTEMSTRNISWGGRDVLVLRADNLTTFMCRLSWNMGDSTSWNPSGPVMGLVYFYDRDWLKYGLFKGEIHSLYYMSIYKYVHKVLKSTCLKEQRNVFVLNKTTRLNATNKTAASFCIILFFSSEPNNYITFNKCLCVLCSQCMILFTWKFETKSQVANKNKYTNLHSETEGYIDWKVQKCFAKNFTAFSCNIAIALPPHTTSGGSAYTAVTFNLYPTNVENRVSS